MKPVLGWQFKQPDNTLQIAPPEHALARTRELRVHRSGGPRLIIADGHRTLRGDVLHADGHAHRDVDDALGVLNGLRVRGARASLQHPK
eukprot:5249670-Alexandrium_andersonii.AAC.1